MDFLEHFKGPSWSQLLNHVEPLGSANGVRGDPAAGSGGSGPLKGWQGTLDSLIKIVHLCSHDEFHQSIFLYEVMKIYEIWGAVVCGSMLYRWVCLAKISQFILRIVLIQMLQIAHVSSAFCHNFTPATFSVKSSLGQQSLGCWEAGHDVPVSKRKLCAHPQTQIALLRVIPTMTFQDVYFDKYSIYSDN